MGIISEALDAYAKSIQVVFSDRMSTVGASEIGQCARKTFWLKNEDDKRLSVPRDAGYRDSWGARLRGTMFESHMWVPAMRAQFGERLLFAGAEQKTFVHNFLSATPDGLICNLTPTERRAIGTDSGCVLVECKTYDPRTNLAEPKPEHKYQVIVQLGLVRATTKYKPAHGVLSYIDASFWSDGKEFLIEFDEEIYANAQERASQIMTSTDVKEMPPEGWIAGGAECRHCPFTSPCGIERRNLPFEDNLKEIDPQLVAEFADMARDILKIEKVRDKSDEMARAMQNELKNRLREKGIRKVPGVLQWSTVKGRSGYDNKAVKEAAVKAGVDIEQYATQGEPSDRLTILIGPKA